MAELPVKYPASLFVRDLNFLILHTKRYLTLGGLDKNVLGLDAIKI